VFDRSPDTAATQRALAVFTGPLGCHDAPLAERVSALEMLAELLDVGLSRSHTEALQDLGRYLSEPVATA
jgi:hypothetical protein